MELSAIIVTFNNEAHIKNCLTSLIEALKDWSWELIVWDNCSIDSTQELLKMHAPPGSSIITHSENIGFAAAINEAAKPAKGKHLLILNPDAEVPRHAPQLLRNALENDSSVGVAGALIVSQHGSRLAGGGWMPSVPRMLSEAFALPSLFSRMSKTGVYARFPQVERSSAYPVEWVAGTFLMTPRQAWDVIGGMSEHWFMYCEDIDFGMRLKTRGLRAILVPSAKIFHVGGGSDPEQSNTGPLQVSGLRDVYELWMEPGLFRRVLFGIALWMYFAGRFLIGAGNRRSLLTQMRLSVSRPCARQDGAGV